ncbi:MAG: transporter substrate-binding domain-containing protein [Oscillospiraceae bacterium]|jgi:ABC-type amino acid transport substrate-binding protein|nr:transporter substrate-binding domain-containing protein [Oscillospiraceae bacterium]
MKHLFKRIAALTCATILTASLLGGCGSSGEKGKIESPDDFIGKTIAVQSETTASDNIAAMKAANKNGKKITVVEYPKVTQCFEDLALGRVDAVYVDSVVAAYYIYGDEKTERVWISETAEPMGICLDKNSVELAATIEAAIDTLYYNGTIRELALKNFHDDFTVGLRTVDTAPVIPTGYKTIKAGTLTVGSEISYPPMEYTEDGTTYQGFDIDVAKALGELLGLKVEFVDSAWQGIFDGLGKGSYDCVISSVSITPERQAAYILTEPYVANALCIVTTK